MAYSYPVYRLGMVFTTKEMVSVNDAGAIAHEIQRNAETWDELFKRAASQDNHASSFSTSSEKVIQRVRESYILSFPAIRFKLAEHEVESRISVTVCMHGHQSKIWLKLTCAAINETPAVNLTAEKVEHFFSMAEQKARAILPTLATEYLKYVKQAGVELPPSLPSFYFQLRAFNSARPSSAELCAELGKELSVQRALESDKYRSELQDYFTIVFGERARPEAVIRAMKDGAVDVFGYKSPEHDALFSLRTTETEADLCGYGFDDTQEVRSDLLAQATTRDLLNEYAREF